MKNINVSPLPIKVLPVPPFLYAVSQNISVLELNTGKFQWQYPFQGVVCPTITPDIVYVNVNNGSYHSVQAIHIPDGKLFWSYQAEGYLSDAPVAADGSIYVSIAKGKICALRASDGALLWHFTVKPDQNVSSFLAPILFTSPTVADGVIYVAPAVDSPLTPFVYALQASNGTLLWKTPVVGSPRYGLVREKNSLYLCTSTVCVALQASDGSLLWQYQSPGELLSPPVIMDTHIYITVADYRHGMLPRGNKPVAILCALDASDGTLLWQVPLSGEENPGGTRIPTTGSSTLYFSEGNGYLTALQGSDGTLLWRIHVGSTQLSLPEVINDKIYIGASDGYVYSFQAADGLPHWKAYVSSSLMGGGSVKVLRTQP